MFFSGFIANIFSIGVLATKDMRKHSFNQLLIALCIFDLLFIGVSIPVYSFNLYGILMDNHVSSTLQIQGQPFQTDFFRFNILDRQK